jgi:hypothetical protein
MSCTACPGSGDACFQAMLDRANLENNFSQLIICWHAQALWVGRQWLCRHLSGINDTNCCDAWLIAGRAMDERRRTLLASRTKFGSERHAAGGDDDRPNRHPNVAITGTRSRNWRQERHRDYRNGRPSVHRVLMHAAGCRTAIDDGFRTLTARPKRRCADTARQADEKTAVVGRGSRCPAISRPVPPPPPSPHRRRCTATPSRA